MKIDDIITTQLVCHRRTGKIIMVDHYSNYKYLVLWNDTNKSWAYVNEIEIDKTKLRHDKLNQLL